MENREAIDIFNRYIACHAEEERCITEVCKDCEYDVTMEEMDEAMRVGISALEKQEPMKPLPQEMDSDGRAITPCGFCGEELPHNSLYDFCPYCGQAIYRRDRNDR